MKEETLEKLEGSMSQLIDWMRSTAENGEEFVTEQAPIIAQEIVLVGRVESSIFALALGAVLFVTAKYFRRIWRADGDAYEQFLSGVTLLLFGGVFTLLFALGVDLAPWLAPKLYVLEQVTGMLP